jgi:hypothetical protein
LAGFNRLGRGKRRFVAASKTLSESPWVLSARAAADDIAARDEVLHEFEVDGFRFAVEAVGDSLWVAGRWPQGSRTMLRTAYAAGDDLTVDNVKPVDDGVVIHASAAIGRYEVTVVMPEPDQAMIHATTRLIPAVPMRLHAWPNDLVALGRRGTKHAPKGAVDLQPTGLSSSVVQLHVDGAGSLFYLQDLTSLGDYAEHSKVSLSGSVSASWPEAGFCLPAAKDGGALPAGKSVVVSDAFVRMTTDQPGDQFALAKQYLDHLAAVYVHLRRPDTQYHDWTETARESLRALEECVGCWSFAAGKTYLNAYLSDYKTPPELMVQLAVMLPLLDYSEFTGEEPAPVKPLRETLATFWDDQLQVVRRWLPSRDDELDGSEEHKKPDVMDSWYLYHTLLNLGRLAKRNGEAKELFLGSLDYAIAAAKQFDYDWPIFFNLKTLEVIKAESEPGAGGERDVPGLYTHVMLQAWELTDDRRYLSEAEQAARALGSRGFDIFYQANVTTFGAQAMVWLWKVTKRRRYLDICYLCLANVFTNMWLWDCNYGFGRSYKTFLSVIPVKDAPYVACYEEQEVCATFATLLSDAHGEKFSRSASLLLSEYIRMLEDRAWCFYPRNLPKEMLADRPKTGELERKLMVPIEDLCEGWEQSGAVGQEVYGASLAIGIVVRHYHPVSRGSWILYTESLVVDLEETGRNAVHFTVTGDQRITTRVRLLGEAVPRDATVTASLAGEVEELRGTRAEDGSMEYTVRGGQHIVIEW